LQRRVVLQKLTHVSEVLAGIAVMTETTCTPETSVDFNRIHDSATQKRSHLHIRRLENLKSYLACSLLISYLRDENYDPHFMSKDNVLRATLVK
jgi:hypothetical protein